MNKDFKPESYNSVSPYFIVKGAQKLIDLLQEVFDAEELRRYDMPDGSIMHAEIRIDDSVIMLGDASEKFPAMTQVIHVYVPDVDEVFSKAVAAGCRLLKFPKKIPATQTGDVHSKILPGTCGLSERKNKIYYIITSCQLVQKQS